MVAAGGLLAQTWCGLAVSSALASVVSGIEVELFAVMLERLAANRRSKDFDRLLIAPPARAELDAEQEGPCDTSCVLVVGCSLP